MKSLDRDGRLALTALGAIGLVTVAWWLLALAPAAGGPEWLSRTREVCFDLGPDGLPGISGWMLLIGQPLVMAGFLAIVWPGPLKRGLAWILDAPLGRVAGVLAAVIVQGALGGARVVLDQRTLAMIHGCTGPLFFGIATATAVMSSRWWIEGLSFKVGSVNKWIVWSATGLLASAYLQLVVGAQLRHLTGSVPIKLFNIFVHSHLTMAGAVFLLALVTATAAWLSKTTTTRVRRPAILVVGLVFIQIALGIGTWVVNYALPWPEMYESLAAYTILAKGFWESLIVTAHVATGSLIISLAVVVALRAWRTSSLSQVGRGLGTAK